MDEEVKTTHAAGSPSKRSLLKAAWVAPIVVAVTLPRSGLQLTSVELTKRITATTKRTTATITARTKTLSIAKKDPLAPLDRKLSMVQRLLRVDGSGLDTCGGMGG